MKTKKKKAAEPTPEETAKWYKHFRKLSNSARYDEAYRLAKRLLKQYPGNLLFAYIEAVMTAEDEVGYSKSEQNARKKFAARKLRKLLFRSRAMEADFRKRVRNEYYWFSAQPFKQYKLGQEHVNRGDKHSNYSSGVGAAMLARKYALAGRKSLCLRWARKSELAWKNYFKVMPDWYNSYLFYAAALGYQGRIKEMDQAFAKAARIAGKPKGWNAIKKYRKEALEVLAHIE